MDPLSLLSIGSTALKGFGSAASAILSGDQQSQMDSYQSQRLADAAEYGKAAAAQTDMAMRLQLQQHLGQMMATRASANTDPSSPTGAAILARTQGQGDQERAIQVGNQLAQVGADEQGSQMYAKAGQQTLMDSFINAGFGVGGTVLGALGAPLTSGPTVGGTLFSGLKGLI